MTILETAIGSLIAGAFTAYGAYISVRETLKGQSDIEGQKRDEDLAAVRLALHTEVGMVALQCLLEFKDWSEVLKHPGQHKDLHTAYLPPLKIYDENAHYIGRLS